MIDPEDFYLVAIRLSKEQGGSEYTKMLASARRCISEFTIPLVGSDFRLVLRCDLEEFLACIEDSFLGTYTRQNVLVLPAFPLDKYSTPFYQEALDLLLEDVLKSVVTLRAKLKNATRVSARTYNTLIRQTEHYLRYLKDEEVSKLQSFILQERDKAGVDRKKVVRKVLKVFASRFEQRINQPED